MVNVVGLGYIGLPTALMMASHGVEVVGTDFSANLVASLQAGRVTFQEDGLEELFAQAVQKGIRFSTEYQQADIYIIAVPTPYLEETKKVDATYVVNAVKAVLPHAPKGAVLVVESTISPGTIDQYVRPAVIESGRVIGEDIFLAHAPERIIPGNMLYELLHNDRTVGADDKAVAEKVKAVYGSFCQGEIVVTDIRTAEMSKVVENTFRDINIAFANELAKLCRENGMDVYEIISIANRHPRVNILSPGPGVGGHCIPIDPWFLVGDYPEATPLIRTAREINDGMPAYVYGRIRGLMDEFGISDLSRVGLYGLTYKADVDDVRSSPTMQLLNVMGPTDVKVYDPMVSRELVPNQYHDLDAFLAAVELVVVLVDHTEIRRNQEKLADKKILDTRHIVKLPQVRYL